MRSYRTGGGGAPIVPPAPATVDLHTHTNRSDGILEPAALVEAVAAAGVRTLAITDHDTLAAIPRAAEAARRNGVDLIPGLEINSIADNADGFHEGELHILGFGVDPAHAGLGAALDVQRQQRRRRFWLIVERLEELELPIDDLVRHLPRDDDDALGRPTIARALVAKGYVATVDDAFRDLLSRGRPAYVPRQGLGPRGAIEAIRGAGGLPVLAHFADAATRPSVVRDLIAIGLGGLEVYYRAFSAELVEALANVAADLRLVPTGGSDYHGDREPYADAHAALWVPPEVGSGLRSALLRGAAGAAAGTDGPDTPRTTPPTP